jgi:hypothetical protein
MYLIHSSTGPKTQAGKAKASQNARTHGLNSVPPEDDVRLWFNIIMDDVENAWETVRGKSPLADAALRLATSEARYHRAMRYADTRETDPNGPQQVLNRLAGEVQSLLEEMRDDHDRNPPDPYDLAEINFGVKQMEKLLEEAERQRRVSHRYLAEATAQRRRALREWCACRQTKNSQIPKRTQYSPIAGVDQCNKGVHD